MDVFCWRTETYLCCIKICIFQDKLFERTDFSFMRCHCFILISIIILILSRVFFFFLPLASWVSYLGRGVCVCVLFLQVISRLENIVLYFLSFRSGNGPHCIPSFKCLIQIFIKALGFYWRTIHFCNTSYDPLRNQRLLDRNQCLHLCLTIVFSICQTVWIFLIIMIIS